MLHGVVTLTFKNDTEAVVDWSARAEIARDADGTHKLKFYQVYLVSLPCSVDNLVRTSPNRRC